MGTYWNKALKKGKIGEDLVEPILERTYEDVAKSDQTKPHDYDFECYKNNGDLDLIDIKTKPKRRKYLDNGIDYTQYLKYLKVAHVKNAKSFWLYFVDEDVGRIYKADLLDPKLPVLNQMDRRRQKLIIYIHLSDTKRVCDIDEDVCEVLKNMTQSKFAGKNK